MTSLMTDCVCLVVAGELPGHAAASGQGDQLHYWRMLWQAINGTNNKPTGLYAWKHLDIAVFELACMTQRWLVHHLQLNRTHSMGNRQSQQT